MTLIDLFETRFEILRVLAFYRPRKIENWSIFDGATAQNVKSVKIWFGRFLDIFKKAKKFGQLHSLSMALFGLFETRFEILRVSAFCRPQKIENYSIFDEVTAQNVKVVKNHFGRFSIKF